VLEVSFQLDSPVYTYTVGHTDLHEIQLAVELQNVTTANSGGLHYSTLHTKATNNQKIKLTVTNLARNWKLVILIGYAVHKHRETNFRLLSWLHTLK
jgi:hypothetical protein